MSIALAAALAIGAFILGAGTGWTIAQLVDRPPEDTP